MTTSEQALAEWSSGVIPQAEIDEAAALGVSVADLRTARAVSSALSGLGTYTLASPVSYSALEDAYSAVCAAAGHEPKVARTSGKTYAEIQMKFQTQQRFATYSPTLGLSGMRWNGCLVIRDATVAVGDISFFD